MTFEMHLGHLKLQASDFPDPPSETGDPYANWFNGVAFESSHLGLKAAEKEYKRGRSDAAWSYLLQAARALGYLSGLSSASYLGSPRAAISADRRDSGRKGGGSKGKNYETRRDQAARFIIAAAPKEKWRSREAFERWFLHLPNGAIPGLARNDYQLSKLLERKDLISVLPPPTKRRR